MSSEKQGMGEKEMNQEKSVKIADSTSVKRVAFDLKSDMKNNNEQANANENKKLHSTTYFGPDGKERTFIQARDKRLALDRNVGQRKIITDSSKESEAGGYWCDVCKCSLKDNRAWLDHINGRKHQQHLGNVMRVERVDSQAVKEKFAALKNKQNKVSAKDLYLKKREEERKRLEEEKKKKEEVEEEDEEAKQMREMMGFSSFSTMKKK